MPFPFRKRKKWCQHCWSERVNGKLLLSAVLWWALLYKYLKDRQKWSFFTWLRFCYQQIRESISSLLNQMETVMLLWLQIFWGLLWANESKPTWKKVLFSIISKLVVQKFNTEKTCEHMTHTIILKKHNATLVPRITIAQPVLKCANSL